MKIGFNKGGLTIDGKKFNPLDLSVDGHGIETDDNLPNAEPFECLENLSSARGEGATRLDQIRALRSVLRR
ncbi:hypothetical protein [Dethiobacter alkaliphilus]|uniref:Uncharacterized protein n=1 Tax=Dethiobacter alkaliphilus AHT 1 TaxID=555088 RepID=C0GCN9_DETAL|nr:hypothetical protein [Dethiobacter alkaliphilus]EEG78974.1 hypothetical protein DealDRAFT_0248 [Dethiobacter alkaliphilus AHT 1]